MFPNQQMNVIRHNRACAAGVFTFNDRLTKGIGDHAKLVWRKRQQLMCQHVSRLLIEDTNFAAGRLDALPPKMQLAKFREKVVSNCARC
jgi:hypothetical protein